MRASPYTSVLGAVDHPAGARDALRPVTQWGRQVFEADVRGTRAHGRRRSAETAQRVVVLR